MEKEDTVIKIYENCLIEFPQIMQAIHECKTRPEIILIYKLEFVTYGTASPGYVYNALRDQWKISRDEILVPKVDRIDHMILMRIFTIMKDKEITSKIGKYTIM